MNCKLKVVAALLAATTCISTSANAGTDSDLAELRAQIRQMREGYEAQINALEQRLLGLEKNVRAEKPVVVDIDPVAARAAGPSGGVGTFNPAISVVLNGAYGNFSKDPDRYALSGFVPANNGLSPGTRGLSLRESELSFAANIDPDYRGNLLLSFDEANAVSVEEAYVQTIGLGNGLSVKGGRFFSALRNAR